MKSEENKGSVFTFLMEIEDEPRDDSSGSSVSAEDYRVNSICLYFDWRPNDLSEIKYQVDPHRV